MMWKVIFFGDVNDHHNAVWVYILIMHRNSENLLLTNLYLVGYFDWGFNGNFFLCVDDIFHVLLLHVKSEKKLVLGESLKGEIVFYEL